MAFFGNRAKKNGKKLVRDGFNLKIMYSFVTTIQ